MAYTVHLLAGAARDIEEIYRYVAEQDGVSKADRLLISLETAWRRLADFPERGNPPKELRAMGLQEFREVHYKPYRIVYKVIGRRVVIYTVLDGRRDVARFLQRRLLR